LNIALSSIGKKFNRQWLFRNIDLRFESGRSYALTGFNGSGKSTLLQLIYGYQVPSAGTILFSNGEHPVAPEELFRHIAIAAPYIELPEELTLNETLQFHFSFKTFDPSASIEQAITDAGLAGNEHKQIRYFSSGMKQRLRLILALYNECEVLLLDEPCSNLDDQGIVWYRELMLRRKGSRTIIIASNQAAEYDFCDAVFAVTDFKPALPAK
jgi:ABC-type multidrug transport system ATPase subunit